MNKIVKLLFIERGMRYAAARDLVEETRDEINRAISEGRGGDADQILMKYLGLKTDYLIDLWGE